MQVDGAKDKFVDLFEMLYAQRSVSVRGAAPSSLLARRSKRVHGFGLQEVSRLIQGGDQILGQVRSHENNTGFDRVLVHGAHVDARRSDNAEKNGTGLQTQANFLELLVQLCLLAWIFLDLFS